MSSKNFVNPPSFLLVCLLLLAPLAHAQNFVLFDSNTIEAKDESFKPHLQFELKALSYMSESRYDHSNQQQGEMQLGYGKKGFLFSEGQAIVGTFSEAKSSYFAVPQLYLGLGDSKKNFGAVGRLKRNYNFLDSYYNLGLYNSYFSNDYINYEEQGLTGLHLQVFDGFFGAFVGLHPYFFPNQGPQVHEENGSLSSSNRWSQRPPPQFEFGDQNRRIEYAIRDYKLKEIIENPGGVASVFIGSNSDRPVLQLSYANHPVNEIPLTRDTYGSATDFVGHVNLSPVVTYHEVQSADVNLDFSNIKTTLSYAEDKVRNKVAAESETLQSLSPMKIYGAYAAIDLSSWLKRGFVFSLAAAEFKGGEITDLTSEGKESIFTFSSYRNQFRSPTTVGFSTELFFVNRKPFQTQVRWTYDRVLKGSLASLLFSFEPANHVVFQLGADLIGVEQSISEDATSNFLDRNQANDRVYGGLQYAF